MKTRIGFVSNSSTTSFCVLGAYLDKQDIIKVFNKAIENNVSFYSKGKNNYYGQPTEQYPKSIEEIDNIFSNYKDNALLGYSIENKNIIEITENAKKLIEVLNVPETSIRVNTWSYTND